MRCFGYSFVQFERLTSPKRILENGSLEGRNTKKKVIYQERKKMFKDERDYNGQGDVNCVVYIP